MTNLLRTRAALLVVLALAAAALRLWLGTQYYGWEESDYGNLAMTRGVLESGFRHFDMNHLPMYYGLSAAVMALVGDAVVASRAVSLIGGVLTVAAAALLADRVLGRRVAWAAGLALVVQPELALYAASSLREPVYAAAVVGALLAMSHERLALASALAGVAFLTRMDALMTVGGVLAVHALGRPPRARRVLAAALPLAAVVVAWAAYCQEVHGTWRFWAHSVAVNVETGGAEAPAGLAWALDGLKVVAALLLDVLPSRIGWLLWAGVVVELAALDWRRHSPRRSLALASLALLGFWLGIGFIAQHEPGHNLYWKWLHGVLPPLILLGTSGAWRVFDRLAAVAGWWPAALLLAVGAAQGLAAMGTETHRQLEVSAALYKPQAELARWIEDHAAPGDAMLVDNIPGCWLDRRPHGLKLHSWFDVPVPPDDPDAFAGWVAGERLRYVLWFQEDWTQAPVIAPWLAAGEVWSWGPVTLRPTRAEPGYGWIFYEVELTDE
ncbi:MAG: glycosyltransferase family 39 protein [Alphaproteobacteria bacterium]|nr:glycosyltransferase family 39 protein [Alphaproteobacteria bacterium]